MRREFITRTTDKRLRQRRQSATSAIGNARWRPRISFGAPSLYSSLPMLDSTLSGVVIDGGIAGAIWAAAKWRRQ
jgi:hypothetical protein